MKRDFQAVLPILMILLIVLHCIVFINPFSYCCRYVNKSYSSSNSTSLWSSLQNSEEKN